MIKRRITPEHIATLNPNEVYVFGANLLGEHHGGAAKTALEFGAAYGEGIGRHGSTYAIPTKRQKILGQKERPSLTLDVIETFICLFIMYARKNPDEKFLVTKIGCGRAGYEPKDIAPLFLYGIYDTNIYLPESFWEVLEAQRYSG